MGTHIYFDLFNASKGDEGNNGKGKYLLARKREPCRKAREMLFRHASILILIPKHAKLGFTDMLKVSRKKEHVLIGERFLVECFDDSVTHEKKEIA
jgi:hypothetical protein